MTTQYKVVSEEGVEVDGVLLAQGEILDVEPDFLNVPQLLEDGSIEEVVVSEDEEVLEDSELETPSTSNTQEATSAPVEEEPRPAKED